MTVALYAGRFDPVTNGHLDIATRAASMFEQLVIGVAASRSALFSLEERIALFEDGVKRAGLTNVRITSIAGLTVEEARSQGAQVLVRGLRAGDFGYEFDMTLMNRHMAPDIDSVYLMTALEHSYVSGTRVRELASFHRDVSEFVSPAVNDAILKKFAPKTD
ncbi:MAG: pantetheine-phosphate adenylyltransferase [Chloroflexi bacterium]|nr:pantetheine-phosphate adenylyltransferase [Chloroflexota bacterium]MDA1240315.1 pantetheine-phosphate adenylyltransferase [Chloroflexota bacterium]MQC25774.1 pantetheine-phosphate adenylyltransferase [Chloroflexota bacterium]MQC47780.1 pantetheine-phosphate adenylyltransferase [Chloroflexota bacterium]